MTTQYTYFISFAGLTKDGAFSGFGNRSHVTDKPITTFEDLQDIKQQIEATAMVDQGAEINCAILNYQLLNKTEI